MKRRSCSRRDNSEDLHCSEHFSQSGRQCPMTGSRIDHPFELWDRRGLITVSFLCLRFLFSTGLSWAANICAGRRGLRVVHVRAVTPAARVAVVNAATRIPKQLAHAADRNYAAPTLPDRHTHYAAVPKVAPSSFAAGEISLLQKPPYALNIKTPLVIPNTDAVARVRFGRNANTPMRRRFRCVPECGDQVRT